MYRISCLAYPGAVGVLGGAEVVLQEDNHLVNYELVQHVPNMVKYTTTTKKKFNTVYNLITFSIIFTKKIFFFFFRSKNLMNLYSKTFYILNFQKKKKIMVK